MKRTLILSVTVLLFIAGVGFYYIYRDEELEVIELAVAKENVVNDLETVKSQEEQIFKWISSKELDTGHLEGKNDDVFNRYRQKKGVVEFLFAAILLEDPNHFIQSFKVETVSADLFEMDNPNKIEVAAEFLNKISRNGQLETVGYEDKIGLFNSESNEAQVDLHYSDGKKVTLTLSFEKTATHHDKDDEIYSITTSPLELIEVIEKST
ncbi:hypothetical protein ACFFIX_20345 [Metabacillus herbersteinensis]|uniref:Uncharacterized protein n=1 Tax=Metabacillus herbersteinensis TaxID=283816 RepID=A0ABV6GJ66_9BACI